MPQLRLRPAGEQGAMSGMRDGDWLASDRRGECMKRRLFNILSALSLLLCVVLGVLWARSYRMADAIGYSDKDTAGALTTADGFLLLWVWQTNDPKIMQGIWATPGLHYEATAPG